MFCTSSPYITTIFDVRFMEIDKNVDCMYINQNSKRCSFATFMIMSIYSLTSITMENARQNRGNADGSTDTPFTEEGREKREPKKTVQHTKFMTYAQHSHIPYILNHISKYKSIYRNIGGNHKVKLNTYSADMSYSQCFSTYSPSSSLLLLLFCLFFLFLHIAPDFVDEARQNMMVAHNA